MKNKIFISYKNSVDGEPTPDSKMAAELYDALENAGIPSFFAGKSLQKVGSALFKEKIDKELDQCAILVVVGTSLNNINSGWVKYEWDGFSMDILNGQKNGKVFTYVDGIDPHNLPRTLRSMQSFDKAKDSIKDIVIFLKNALTDLGYNSVDEAVCDNDDENISTDSCCGALEFSSMFFHSGANKIKNFDLPDLENEVRRISRLYRSIFSLEHRGQKIPSDDIAETITDIIHKGIESGNETKLLKIKGPLGSYKNRLLQYIYLALERKEKGILPFYIDIAIYEKAIENQSINKENQLEQLVENHFKQIEDIISKDPKRKPLIIIDGIRDFSSGRDQLYSNIKRHLSRISCVQIVSLDTDFTNNYRHKFSVHPLAGTDYEYFIRITSMSIYSKDACIDFIQQCLDIFQIRIPYASVDATVIYNRLSKLSITNLDAYWLANLLTEMLGNILNENMTAADLYEAICRKTLDLSEIESAAELAYQFEYGVIDFSNSAYFFDARWKVMRKHRSMLDYLIARYYILNLDKLNLSFGKEIQEQLHFFNMILPKSITAFVSPMINRIDAYENKVLTIANMHYDNMSILEKNQLVYWMGRLKSSTSIEESTFLLKKYKESQLLQYQTHKDDPATEKKHAFHLRTICVSLIALDDQKTAEEYFRLLLQDKTSNSTNRAFHLTYYGDKTYNPNMSLLDFEDDVRKGIYTFEVLCASVQAKLDAKVSNYMLLLELFTLCSLLQARTEAAGNGQTIMPCEKYAEKTRSFLRQISKSRRLAEFEALRDYFNWMFTYLTEYCANGTKHTQAAVYHNYCQARETKRAGWVNRKISNPENIVEHMYNCWLMGAMYLPERSDNPSYNKQCILNMLLIHDIGEVKTGDIVRPEKQLHKQDYDKRENEAMYDLVFLGSFPKAKDATFFPTHWDEWYHQESINYQIAKDIDIIQGLYQFSCYYLTNNDIIEYDDALEWFDEIYNIQTKEGREILQHLILKNEMFVNLVKEMGLENGCDDY